MSNRRCSVILALAVGLCACSSGHDLAPLPGAADAGTSDAGKTSEVSLPADGATSTDAPLYADAAVDAAVKADALTDVNNDGAQALDAATGDAAQPDAVGDRVGPSPDLGPATLGELSPKQLHDMLASKDFLLIDVHYPNAGSVPGTNARIAYDDIPALVAFIGTDLAQKVVLTCLSGHMSKDAGDKLAARGYRNIWELTGGTSAWTSAGYTLVRLDGGL